MRTFFRIPVLALAAALAFAAVPTPASAMQNIKCIAADRAALKEWTGIATEALTDVAIAAKAVEVKQKVDLAPLTGKLDRLIGFDAKRLATPELRKAMLEVQERLTTLRTALREAQGERVLTPLKDTAKLLEEHTAAPKG